MPGAIAPQRASRITRLVAILSVCVALTLVILKFWAWRASGSVAMLSSLADSGLDFAASGFTLFAVAYAARPPDEDHRFGHGKAEGLAAMVQAGLVAGAGVLVAAEAVERFANPRTLDNGGIAIGVMAVSIALSVGLIAVQTVAVRRTGSVATEGDRAHYLSDLAANLAVIAGIAASAFFGVTFADPLIGVAVAAWLVWTAIGVARRGLDQLMDRELDDAARERIRALALEGDEILNLHALRTRAAGPRVHIQFHADLAPGLSLAEAHRRMVAVERRIMAAFPGADILIHPDPVGLAEPHGLDQNLELDEA